MLGVEEPNLPAQSPELNPNQHLCDIGLGVLDLTNTLGIKCEEIPTVEAVICSTVTCVVQCIVTVCTQFYLGDISKNLNHTQKGGPDEIFRHIK